MPKDRVKIFFVSILINSIIFFLMYKFNSEIHKAINLCSKFIIYKYNSKEDIIRQESGIFFLEDFVSSHKEHDQLIIDATSTLQRAVNAICNQNPKGGHLRLPPGILTFRAMTSLSWNCPISLDGTGWSELPSDGGTWFHIIGNNASLFSLSGPSVRGSSFNDIGIFQDEPSPNSFVGSVIRGTKTITRVDIAPEVGSHVIGPGVPIGTIINSVSGKIGNYTLILNSNIESTAEKAIFGYGSWIPKPYPSVFNIHDTYGIIRFHNILVSPVYDLIHADLAGRMEIDGLYGQILHTAIYDDRSWDVAHFTGPMHIWDFWSQNPLVLDWQTSHADVIIMPDYTAEIPDFFAYGYHSCIKLTQSPAAVNPQSGFPQKVHFGTLYCDASKFGVWNDIAKGDVDYQKPQIVIDNFEHTGLIPYGVDQISQVGSASIQVDEQGGVDMQIGHFRSEVTSVPINLQGNTYSTLLRIGDFHAWGYSSGAAIVDAGSCKDDISISSRPIIQKTNILSDNNGKSSCVSYFYSPIKGPEYKIIYNGGVLIINNDVEGVNMISNFTQNIINEQKIVLPNSPFEGQVVSLMSNGAISKLTVTIDPSSGQHIEDNTPLYVLPHQEVSYRYTNSNHVRLWYRMNR
ncbi:hypothetical protein [Komagataeibacter melaceti]|uniref:hypothetical protein n=1 Tax=Komagataeibacter melaceti TaxID=2766577 RepID=UPI0011E58DD2|nr:hypothetical protein [Komagataeibacter melaceti]